MPRHNMPCRPLTILCAAVVLIITAHATYAEVKLPAGTFRLLVCDLTPAAAYALTCGDFSARLQSTGAGTLFVKDLRAGEAATLRLTRQARRPTGPRPR